MTSARPQTVPEDLWPHLEAVGRPHALEPRHLLWEPGDLHDGDSYLVLGGLIRLYHPSRDGGAVTLLVAGSGALLGHHASLQPHNHATGAETMCSSRVLVLPVAAVGAWLTERDEVGRSFVQWLRTSVTGQLADTYTRLELEHDTAPARVAHVLLALDRQRLLDRMTRQDLADLANLTLETTVRTISRFVREGLLAGSRFTVLSEDERLALAAILEPYEPSELPYS